MILTYINLIEIFPGISNDYIDFNKIYIQVYQNQYILLYN